MNSTLHRIEWMLKASSASSYASAVAGEMKAGGILLMLFIGVAEGTFRVESCDMIHKTACYGTLNQTMHLQMSQDAKTFDVAVYHNYKRVFLFRSKISKSVYVDSATRLKRLEFIPKDGILEIRSLQNTDSGRYCVTYHDQEGKSRLEKYIQLVIEAPVDTPVLTDLCEDELRTVNCSSSGDNPQYSWFLDGRPLGKADVLSADTKTLELRWNVTGELTCSVRNHVSSGNSTKQLESCYETQTTPGTEGQAKAESMTSSPPFSLSGVIIEDKMQWIYYYVIPVSGFLVLICLTVIICVCRKRKTTQSTNTPTTGPSVVNYSDESE